MCGSEVFFALVFPSGGAFRVPRSFLRYFLNLPKATKIAIKSFKDNPVMRKCRN